MLLTGLLSEEISNLYFPLSSIIFVFPIFLLDLSLKSMTKSTTGRLILLLETFTVGSCGDETKGAGSSTTALLLLLSFS